MKARQAYRRQADEGSRVGHLTEHRASLHHIICAEWCPSVMKLPWKSSHNPTKDNDRDKVDKDSVKKANLSGGRGGNGGKGGNVGGAGGLAEAPSIPLEASNVLQGGAAHWFFFKGDTGGNGGAGDDRGGAGGIGQGQKFGARLVSVSGKVGNVLALTVSDFCREYHLSDKIRNLLDEQGFETAGALLEVSDISLLQDGFKPGQVAELKRALKELLVKNGVSIPV
ncbi:hypothetical protein DFH09DRAFT_1100127 [Mycena vulgaris]|nr:hypothetical protein DFH09DRAFT_1100127 [Mycena vulgaris]